MEINNIMSHSEEVENLIAKASSKMEEEAEMVEKAIKEQADEITRREEELSTKLNAALKGTE